MGQSDSRNVSTQRRDGYEPVRAEDHPELMLSMDHHSGASGNVEIGGLMLCKAPIELVEERNAYYNEQAKAQMRSVDNNLMRENDPRMPLFNERKTKVTFGNGT